MVYEELERCPLYPCALIRDCRKIAPMDNFCATPDNFDYTASFPDFARLFQGWLKKSIDPTAGHEQARATQDTTIVKSLC